MKDINENTHLALYRKYRPTDWENIVGQEHIVKAIENYQHETSWQTLLKEAGLALVVIIAAGLVIYALQRIFNWSQQKII